MAIVQKGNRQLTIEDSKVERLLAQGYKQINEKGKTIKEPTGGRTPTIADLEAKDKEIAKLKAELEKATKDKAKDKESGGKGKNNKTDESGGEDKGESENTE